MNLPRRIKPNPNDPDWKFPYASRQAIENIRRYMEQCGSKTASFGGPKRCPEVLDHNRKVKIPWESVPPHYRARCQELFDRKVSLEIAKGIPGWPSAGKIRSIRMNCTNAGRHFFNGENFLRYSMYKRKKKMWILYQQWLLDEEKKNSEVECPVTKHRVLEVG